MSSRYDVRDPDYEQRVQASFAQQGLLTTLAAELGLVEGCGGDRGAVLARSSPGRDPT